MNLFGSSSEKTTKIEDSREYNQEGNAGAIANGNGNNISVTDHGAIKAGLSVANNALLANSAALNKSLSFGTNALNKSLDFGTKSLDFGAHALDKNSEHMTASLNTVTNFAQKILANGAQATKTAMSLAKHSTTDNTQKNTDLMIKMAGGLAAMTVIFMIYVTSKKR